MECPVCRQALSRDLDHVLFGNVGVDETPLVLPESVIGHRYLLMGRLAGGRSSTVHVALHLLLRKRFAIKILLEGEGSTEDLRRRAMTLARIDCDNVAQVLDLGTTADGRPYLVSELVCGETVAALLERLGRVSRMRAVSIVRQVGAAMVAAHALGYVHGDVRPGKILVKRTGDRDVVKVLDLGVVRRSARVPVVDDGVRRYVSPEQRRNERLDARSDVYALACLAHELVTGGPSPETGTAADHPRLPAAFVAALTRALDPDPAGRFPVVGAFVEALAGAGPATELADLPEEWEDASTARQLVPRYPPLPVPRRDRTNKGRRPRFDSASYPTSPTGRIRSRTSAVTVRDLFVPLARSSDEPGWTDGGPTTDFRKVRQPGLRKSSIVLILAMAASILALLVGMLHSSCRQKARATRRTPYVEKQRRPGTQAHVVPRARPTPAPRDPRYHETSQPSSKDDSSFVSRVDRATPLLVEGWRQHRRGQFAEARRLFARAIRLDPEDPDAHVGLAESAFELGCTDVALLHLRRAVHLEPDRAWYRVLLGDLYLKQGDAARAARQYRRALKRNPHSDSARRGLSLAKRRLHDGA